MVKTKSFALILLLPETRRWGLVLQQLYIILQDYELTCRLSRNSAFFWNSRCSKVQEFPLLMESLPVRWEVAVTHCRVRSWLQPFLVAPVTMGHGWWWVPLSITVFFLLSIIDLQNHSRFRYTTMMTFLYISEWSPQ